MDMKRGGASWTPVSSSNVEAVVWFVTQDRGRDVGVLAVRYLAKGGRPSVVYEYTANRPGGTSEATFHQFLAAPSKGSFRWQVLKPPAFRVEGPFAD